MLELVFTNFLVHLLQTVSLFEILNHHLNTNVHLELTYTQTELKNTRSVSGRILKSLSLVSNVVDWWHKALTNKVASN